MQNATRHDPGLQSTQPPAQPLHTAKTRLGHQACLGRLAPGRAMTLQVRQRGVLHITHGGVWATLEQAGPHVAARAGDHFLRCGQRLPLVPGEAVVLEPYLPGEPAPACFSWAPSATSWRTGVVQPLVDLRLAMGLAAQAVRRLAHGLAHQGLARAQAAVAKAATGF
ncbi:MAG: hypothetical protein JWR68_1710 [Polaromonas sp.]|nr:hypothetical protein [Polaromonas sp.]